MLVIHDSRKATLQLFIFLDVSMYESITSKLDIQYANSSYLRYSRRRIGAFGLRDNRDARNWFAIIGQLHNVG